MAGKGRVGRPKQAKMTAEAVAQKMAAAQDAAQMHLNLKEEDYSSHSTEKLISFSFDENPKIRMKVVYELAKRSSDPTAVFGLIELCADKDEGVKGQAKMELAKLEGDQAASSLEKLFSEKKAEDPDITSVRKKLMPSIERLFSQKAGGAKSHMSGSIEKLFADEKQGESQQAATPRQQSQAGISDIPLISGHDKAEKHGMESLEPMTQDKALEKPHEMEQQTPSAGQLSEMEDEGEGESPEPEQTQAQGPAAVERPEKEEPAREQAPEAAQKSTQFAKSDLVTAAISIAKKPGITEKELKAEEKKMLQKINEEVHAAFAAAKGMLGQNANKRMSELKVGMQRINTQEITVNAVEKVEVKKGKKSSFVFRLTVSDSTGQSFVYLQEAKGKGIEQGDKIKLTGCSFEKNSITGEECITLSPRSKLIIIR